MQAAGSHMALSYIGTTAGGLLCQIAHDFSSHRSRFT